MPPKDPAGATKTGKRPTIRDVAANLGVSLATVSMALNGKGTLSDATRERVKAEAARLGYVAHPYARGLRSSRTNVLALSVRSLDFGGSYRPAGVDHFTRVAGAAAFTALDRGFRLMLVPSRDDHDDDDPRWADGFVIEDPRHNDPLVAKLVAHDIPVVTIGWDPARKSRTAWVATDGQATARVLDLFEARGASRVAFVSGTEPNSWNNVARQVYRDWCRSRGMGPWVIRLSEDAGAEGGAEVARQIMQDGGRPDAVFCQTGRHAGGFAMGCKEIGVRIPQDVLLAAGNDSEQARTADPPITALELGAEGLGRVAVELLSDIIDGTTQDRSRVVSARLIERASTSELGAASL